MKSTSTLALMTLASATTLTGCYSTWDVSPKMLVHLDGFARRDTIFMNSGYQEELPFDENTALHFVGTDRRETTAQFTSISIDEHIFHGTERETKREVYVDMRQLRSVQAKKISYGQTALVTTGMVVAMPAAVAVVALSALSIGFVGRPLRIPGQTLPTRASLRELHRRGRLANITPMNDITRNRLATYWTEQATAECASIPAFLALARDLRLVSAPESLIQTALAAAREEALHTELCTKLANRHANSLLSPIVPPTPTNADIDRTALLKRLVLEAFWDGCVVEGAAAIEAQRAIVPTRDETTRSALQTIAKDEKNHADLAKDILAWGLSAGEPSVRQALAESFEQARDGVELQLEAKGELGINPGIDDDMARAYGLAGNDITSASRIEAWEKSKNLVVKKG